MCERREHTEPEYRKFVTLPGEKNTAINACVLLLIALYITTLANAISSLHVQLNLTRLRASAASFRNSILFLNR